MCKILVSPGARIELMCLCPAPVISAAAISGTGKYSYEPLRRFIWNSLLGNERNFIRDFMQFWYKTIGVRL